MPEPRAVKLTQPFDEHILRSCSAEFEILRRLNHPSVVKAHHLFVDYSLERIYTVLELAEGTGLKPGMSLHVF